MTRIALAFAAPLAVLTFNVAAAGGKNHADYLAGVATYKPIEGFSQVIAGKRFNGFFTARRDACRVTMIVSDADDEALKVKPQRFEMSVGAAQVVTFAASAQEALGVACTVDADAIKVTRLRKPATQTAQR